jgi:LPS O-antigen subunit length determinant protein (WzzB/FepE family)
MLVVNSEFGLKQQKDFNDEVDLADLFLILWNRKMIIAVVTFLCVVAGVVACFFMPKVYEVTAIVEAGRDSEGFLLEDPQNIRENVLGGTFTLSISENLGINQSLVPKFKVVIPKDTDIVKIAVKTSDPERGVAILNALLEEISSHVANRLQIKVAQAANKVKQINFGNQSLDEQIALLEKQINENNKKMESLEDGRRQAMSSSNSDAMGLLLYLSELQVSQIYSNNLQIEKTKLEEQKRANDLALEEAELKLSTLKEGIHINKSPTTPDEAVSPKKPLILILSLLLGVFAGVMLAFVYEFFSHLHQRNT